MKSCEFHRPSRRRSRAGLISRRLDEYARRGGRLASHRVAPGCRGSRRRLQHAPLLPRGLRSQPEVHGRRSRGQRDKARTVGAARSPSIDTLFTGARRDDDARVTHEGTTRRGGRGRAATAAEAEGGAPRGPAAEISGVANGSADRMQEIDDGVGPHRAKRATYPLDPWHLGPGARPSGRRRGDRRRRGATAAVIFTENREGTKRYLRGPREGDRKAPTVPTSGRGVRDHEQPRRKEIRRSYDPAKTRCVSARHRRGAREATSRALRRSLSLTCPGTGRIEQRNGRIDRKIQPAPEGRCHYSYCRSALRTASGRCWSGRPTIKRAMGTSQGTRTTRARLGRASAT